jgi:hypothetical protein
MTRFLAAPAAAVVVLIGVWVAGGVITDSFEASFVLTGLWFAVAGVAALLVGRRFRPVLWPLLAGYAVTAAVVSGYLAWAMFDDKTVNEQVPVAAPASERPVAPAGADAPAPENVLEASGPFRSGEPETSGRAELVRLRDGRRVVTLTGFETSPGPDLRVRLVPGATGDGGADGAVDLGALKGNRGNQVYDVPDGARGGSVVIWCRAFSATFGHAVLERA